MTDSLTAYSTRTRVASWIDWPAAAIISAAFVIRCIGIDNRWLWGDELWSASLAKDGPWTAVLTGLRFDVHPPLYCVQLSLWMLAGHSDQWLMLNSIAWSTGAVALLTFAAADIHGRRIGLAAGALLAVAPAAFAYSDDVRMYSMLLLLIVLAWYTQTRWLNGTAGRRGALWMIAAQCAVAYTHGAGLVMLSGCVLLGGATALLRKDWLLLRRWIAVELVVGVVVAPTIIVALMRGVQHPAVPDLWNFLQTWTFLTTGQSTLEPGYVALGLILFAIFVLAGLRDRAAGLQTATLIFAPLVLAGLVSHLFKPIWLDRTFATVIPFLCLALARAALEKNRSTRNIIGFALLVVIWSGLAMTDQFTRAKGDGFRPAAAAVHQMQHPGDLIVVGANYSYWYFMWYYAGPRWGKPLHAFILNADWGRMLAKLPHPLVALFGMDESDRTRTVDGATVMLWDPDRPIPNTAGTIILVANREMWGTRIPGYRLADSMTRTQLVIERWVPD